MSTQQKSAFICAEINFGRGALWLTTYTDCELAYFVVDHIQDFMADVYSVWWPQIGEQRLDFEIDCVEDRPKLMFTLRLD